MATDESKLLKDPVTGDLISKKLVGGDLILDVNLHVLSVNSSDVKRRVKRKQTSLPNLLLQPRPKALPL